MSLDRQRVRGNVHGTIDLTAAEKCHHRYNEIFQRLRRVSQTAFSSYVSQVLRTRDLNIHWAYCT